MKWSMAFSTPGALLSGVLLLVTACGDASNAGRAPDEELLGTAERAVCADSSVTTLSIAGASTYQGALAGNGDWSVAFPANSVRLEYYVDGVLYSSDERPVASGTWFFSTTNVTCGVSHTLLVKAWPMVIDSAGNRTTCWSAPRSVAQSVFEACPTLSAGDSHTVAQKGGTAWGWGLNNYGQLGDGTSTVRRAPVQVPGHAQFIAVASGSAHSVGLKSDGTVWAWGANGYGQLGDGTSTVRYLPVQVPGLTGVSAIAAGGSHSVALRSDGTVWAWGLNNYGQLGDGTSTVRYLPVRVSGLTGVSAIAAGGSHSVARKSDGTVWGWGLNNYGQLGDGTSTVRRTPVQVSGLTGVSALAAGANHSVAVRQDGTVWAWGANGYGQLGDGTSTVRYLPVKLTGL